MQKPLIPLLLALLSTPALADKLPVLASFSIMADLVQEVGGERVTVSSLVGPDQDAHVFQPAPQDVKKLAAAKVFVVNGLGFEGWLNRLSKSSGFKGQTVVASQGVKPLVMVDDDHDHGHDHGHASQDPHAWHNPQNVKLYVRNISAALTQADPAGKDYYSQRAQTYSQQLEQLDNDARQRFAAIPASQRKVLTSHDAFAYLAQRYQIRFLSPQGVSTEAEASAKGVAKLVRQVKSEKIRAVFMENMSDKRLLEQLSREAGVQIGGKLYADALSPANGPAASYVQLFKHNVDGLWGAMK
ncbi:metal ABC transporter substrate-binding protein [Aquaspirillum sp. LM1]|uniref:metal ABC transporter substrate-binding protein n=1 Tax=Aquaspirillum sp. LM1 TaxID=1938604 RepID=UPI0009839AD8|nr:metal ABC transporter substrate-binding protein [Aquaspirillum sp. LM1]AQR64756.1 metal ABC transporter substrate-binding protein [Aquaspirillum sp. LM1]